MKKNIFYLLLISNLCMYGQIINVPDDHSSIQSGIDAALDGDTVLVYPGTHVENINFKGKNITVASFFIITQDTSYISNTIINGGEMGSVVTFENGEDTTACLVGLTVTNGKAITGAGICCVNSSPSLLNLKVIDNMATASWEGNRGGGIYCSESAPHIKNSIIKNNKISSFNLTHAGAGISIYKSSPLIDSLVICDNVSILYLIWGDTMSVLDKYGEGGGLYCFESDLEISNTCISNNVIGFGGGINSYGSNITMKNVEISGNTGGNYGGGILSRESDINIHHSIIKLNNTSTAAYDPYDGYGDSQGGGGLYIKGSDIFLSDVIIKENHTQMLGGGIFIGDGNSEIHFDDVELCSVFNNHSGLDGTDIYSRSSEPLDIVLDTFTVMNPTGYFASPADMYNFTIHNAFITPVMADLYVSPDGSDKNSGLSADASLKTISHGMKKILADTENPRTIYLSGGRYSPQTTGEIFPLNMKSHVSIQSIADDTSYLDADFKSCIMILYHDSCVLIRDLVLEKGRSTHGNALHCNNSNPVINNLVIRNNNSGGFSFDSHCGASLYLRKSDPSMDKIKIYNNCAGIYCIESKPVMENSEIYYNGGKGISCHVQSNFVLKNSKIHHNQGSGIECRSSDPILNNVTISHNTSHYDGGGILLNGSSNPVLTDVNISHNIASDGGGGIWSGNEGAGLVLNNVSINNNKAFRGGGIYNMGNDNFLFDALDRSSIYLNEASVGSDINSHGYMKVVVDTFTVKTPTEFHAYPANNFEFDILNSIIDQVDADVYVSTLGDNTNSGTSWESPFKTIYHALSAVITESNNPRNIFLSEGVFSHSSTGESFQIPLYSNISIVGLGPEKTILDAERTGRLFYTENSKNVSLRNMTLQNGYVEGQGGGIYSYHSDLLLENMRFSDNLVTRSGGGVHFSGHKNKLLLKNVEISNNKVITDDGDAHGGGLMAVGFADSTSVILDSVIIADNLVICNDIEYQSYGGGIHTSDVELYITRSNISGNYAELTGGITFGSIKNALTLDDVVVANNYGVRCGGIYLNAYDTCYFLNVIVENNYGTGIEYFVYPTNDHPRHFLVNSLVHNNGFNEWYTSRGGIKARYTDLEIINSTITENYGDPNSSGYGLFLRGSTAKITNSILWNNENSEIYFDPDHETSAVEISYSNIRGGEENIIVNNNGTLDWKEGNISLFPYFSGTFDHPYSLLAESPCIDAGQPDTTGLFLSPVDLAGSPRIWNNCIDMGAYEWNDVGINEKTDQDTDLIIHCYPNPSSGVIHLRYSISDIRYSIFELYSIQGIKIRTLLSEVQQPGEYEVTYDIGDLPDGMYFVRLQIGKEVETAKLVLIK